LLANTTTRDGAGKVGSSEEQKEDHSPSAIGPSHSPSPIDPDSLPLLPLPEYVCSLGSDPAVHFDHTALPPALPPSLPPALPEPTPSSTVTPATVTSGIVTPGIAAPGTVTIGSLGIPATVTSGNHHQQQQQQQWTSLAGAANRCFAVRANKTAPRLQYCRCSISSSCSGGGGCSGGGRVGVPNQFPDQFPNHFPNQGRRPDACCDVEWAVAVAARLAPNLTWTHASARSLSAVVASLSVREGLVAGTSDVTVSKGRAPIVDVLISKEREPIAEERGPLFNHSDSDGGSFSFGTQREGGGEVKEGGDREGDERVGDGREGEEKMGEGRGEEGRRGVPEDSPGNSPEGSPGNSPDDSPEKSPEDLPEETPPEVKSTGVFEALEFGEVVGEARRGREEDGEVRKGGEVQRVGSMEAVGGAGEEASEREKVSENEKVREGEKTNEGEKVQKSSASKPPLAPTASTRAAVTAEAAAAGVAGAAAAAAAAEGASDLAPKAPSLRIWVPEDEQQQQEQQQQPENQQLEQQQQQQHEKESDLLPFLSPSSSSTLPASYFPSSTSSASPLQLTLDNIFCPVAALKSTAQSSSQSGTTLFFLYPAVPFTLAGVLRHSPEALRDEFAARLVAFGFLQGVAAAHALGISCGAAVPPNIALSANLWPRLILGGDFWGGLEGERKGGGGEEVEVGRRGEGRAEAGERVETKGGEAAKDEDTCSFTGREKQHTHREPPLVPVSFTPQRALAAALPFGELLGKWMAWEISNLDYLLELNRIAGRRSGDRDFHAVIPWVIDFTVAPFEAPASLSSSSSASDKAAFDMDMLIEKASTGDSPAAAGSLAAAAAAGAAATTIPPPKGWRNLRLTKWRAVKGDEQLDFTYSSSELPHHVAEECVSDVAVCMYAARKLPLWILRRIVRTVFEPKEYPSTMGRMYRWTPDETLPEFFFELALFRSQHARLPDLAPPDWVDGFAGSAGVVGEKGDREGVRGGVREGERERERGGEREGERGGEKAGERGMNVEGGPCGFSEPSGMKAEADPAIVMDGDDLILRIKSDRVHRFLALHRAALEGDFVSSELHHWIDLTFGFCLAGDAALAAKNVVPPPANEEAPRGHGRCQLFVHPHPQRGPRPPGLSGGGGGGRGWGVRERGRRGVGGGLAVGGGGGWGEGAAGGKGPIVRGGGDLQHPATAAAAAAAPAVAPAPAPPAISLTSTPSQVEDFSRFLESTRHLSPIYWPPPEILAPPPLSPRGDGTNGGVTSGNGSDDANGGGGVSANGSPVSATVVDRPGSKEEKKDELREGGKDRRCVSSPCTCWPEDIFVAGCVIAEIFLRRPLFDPDSAHVFATVGSLPPAFYDLPSSIQPVIRGLVDRNPTRRPTAATVLASSFFSPAVRSAHAFLASLHSLPFPSQRLAFAASQAKHGGLGTKLRTHAIGRSSSSGRNSQERMEGLKDQEGGDGRVIREEEVALWVCACEVVTLLQQPALDLSDPGVQAHITGVLNGLLHPSKGLGRRAIVALLVPLSVRAIEANEPKGLNEIVFQEKVWGKLTTSIGLPEYIERLHPSLLRSSLFSLPTTTPSAASSSSSISSSSSFPSSATSSSSSFPPPLLDRSKSAAYARSGPASAARSKPALLFRSGSAIVRSGSAGALHSTPCAAASTALVESVALLPLPITISQTIAPLIAHITRGPLQHASHIHDLFIDIASKLGERAAKRHLVPRLQAALAHMKMSEEQRQQGGGGGGRRRRLLDVGGDEERRELLAGILTGVYDLFAMAEDHEAGAAHDLATASTTTSDTTETEFAASAAAASASTAAEPSAEPAAAEAAAAATATMPGLPATALDTIPSAVDPPCTGAKAATTSPSDPTAATAATTAADATAAAGATDAATTDAAAAEAATAAAAATAAPATSSESPKLASTGGNLSKRLGMVAAALTPSSLLLDGFGWSLPMPTLNKSPSHSRTVSASSSAEDSRVLLSGGSGGTAAAANLPAAATASNSQSRLSTSAELLPEVHPGSPEGTSSLPEPPEPWFWLPEKRLDAPPDEEGWDVGRRLGGGGGGPGGSTPSLSSMSAVSSLSGGGSNSWMARDREESQPGWHLNLSVLRSWPAHNGPVTGLAVLENEEAFVTIGRGGLLPEGSEGGGGGGGREGRAGGGGRAGKGRGGGGGGERVRVWDVGSGECTLEYSGHSEVPLAVCALQGTSLVATCDEVIHIWDSSTGELLSLFEEPPSSLASHLQQQQQREQQHHTHHSASTPTLSAAAAAAAAAAGAAGNPLAYFSSSPRLAMPIGQLPDQSQSFDPSASSSIFSSFAAATAGVASAIPASPRMSSSLFSYHPFSSLSSLSSTPRSHPSPHSLSASALPDLGGPGSGDGSGGGSGKPGTPRHGRGRSFSSPMTSCRYTSLLFLGPAGGNRLVAGTSTGCIRLVDMCAGRLLSLWQCGLSEPFCTPVTALASAATTTSTSSSSSSVQSRRSSPSHPSSSSSSSRSPVSTKCVSVGYHSGHLAFLDWTTGMVVARVKAHSGRVTGLVPCGEYQLLSSSTDSTIALWDIRRAADVAAVERVVAHTQGITAMVALTPTMLTPTSGGGTSGAGGGGLGGMGGVGADLMPPSMTLGRVVMTAAGSHIGVTNVSGLSQAANARTRVKFSSHELVVRWPPPPSDTNLPYHAQQVIDNIQSSRSTPIFSLDVLPFSRLFLAGGEDGIVRLCN
ncbi:hypothetical protein CLOM_g10456, partial [Closterium sp. NIES-68]